MLKGTLSRESSPWLRACTCALWSEAGYCCSSLLYRGSLYVVMQFCESWGAVCAVGNVTAS